MSRLPALGPRGEGWVLLQGLLLAALAACVLLPSAWGGAARTLSAAAGVVLVAAGAALAIGGIRDLRENLTPFPHPRDGATLVESGVYRRVRHPIYGGIVVTALGWGLWLASPVAMLLAVASLAFFDLKSRREEAWLEQRFPGYPAYRARSRRLVPFVY